MIERTDNRVTLIQDDTCLIGAVQAKRAYIAGHLSPDLPPSELTLFLDGLKALMEMQK